MEKEYVRAFSSSSMSFEAEMRKEKEDDKLVIFSMFHYINTLHKVFKKNICPWAQYKDIEMSVFFYIQNLVHKCESILMEQYEQKIMQESLYHNEHKIKDFLKQE